MSNSYTGHRCNFSTEAQKYHPVENARIICSQCGCARLLSRQCCDKNLCWKCWQEYCADHDMDYHLSECLNKLAKKKGYTLSELSEINPGNFKEKFGFDYVPEHRHLSHSRIKKYNRELNITKSLVRGENKLITQVRSRKRAVLASKPKKTNHLDRYYMNKKSGKTTKTSSTQSMDFFGMSFRKLPAKKRPIKIPDDQTNPVNLAIRSKSKRKCVEHTKRSSLKREKRSSQFNFRQDATYIEDDFIVSNDIVEYMSDTESEESAVETDDSDRESYDGNFAVDYPTDNEEDSQVTEKETDYKYEISASGASYIAFL